MEKNAVLLDKEKVAEVVEKLEESYPNAKYYLNFSNPLELLVAAILSAQTKDSVVNEITPKLFSRFKTAEDYANASEDELLSYINRVSFAKAKAANIIKTCSKLAAEYNGKVPDSLDALTELNGVGRKTANTIMINAFGKATGIPVDTWVIKLSYRIGLSLGKNADSIEKDLESKIDKKYWHNIAYILKMHGKTVCGTTPKCSMCVIEKICPKNGVAKKV